MSVSGDIMQKLLDDVKVVDATVTDNVGRKVLDDISVDEYPYAMAYDPTWNPDRLDHAQDEDILVIQVMLVTKDTALLTVLQTTEDIRAQWLLDQTLGDLVDETEVGEITVEENPDSARIAVEFTVETKRII